MFWRFLELGELLGIKNIIFGQSIFWGSGFYMIEMELWHPWILLALVYGVSLAVTIRKLKFMKNQENEEEYKKNSMIFSLAILGARNIFIFSRKKS